MFHLFYRLFSIVITAFFIFGFVVAILEIVESEDQIVRLKQLFWLPLIFLLVAGLVIWYTVVTWKMEKKYSISTNLIDGLSETAYKQYLPSAGWFYIFSFLYALLGLLFMGMFFILLRNIARMDQLTIYNAIPLITNSLLIIYGILTEVYVIRMLMLFRKKKRMNQV